MENCNRRCDLNSTKLAPSIFDVVISSFCAHEKHPEILDSRSDRALKSILIELGLRDMLVESLIRDIDRSILWSYLDHVLPSLNFKPARAVNF